MNMMAMSKNESIDMEYNKAKRELLESRYKSLHEMIAVLPTKNSYDTHARHAAYIAEMSSIFSELCNLPVYPKSKE